MKTQGILISGLIFALLIAIFAVINVDPVEVNFMFATTSLPLILVILISALLGGVSIGLFGILRQYRLQREIKVMTSELENIRAQNSVSLDPLQESAAADGLEAGLPSRKVRSVE